MPLVDMPLEQLKTYQGKNPKPTDFDAFWDKALADMRAMDPQLELIPADFDAPPFAKCFDMYFTGIGGARIHAKLLRPVHADQPHPAVLQFHGYSGDAGDWHGKLSYVARGYTVASLDCRGQGGKSEDAGGVTGNTLRGHIIRGLEDAPDKMLFHQIFMDTAQMAKIVMDMDDVDETRVGVMGGSQGGALTLVCASLEPRVKLAAPAFPFLCDYQRVWEMDLAKAAFDDLGDYFRKFDPLHKREKEIFYKLGYIDVQHFTQRIRGEVMMATGLMDTICPPSTQFSAYNKITSPKSVVIYPDYGHEGLPGWDDQVYQFMGKL